MNAEQIRMVHARRVWDSRGRPTVEAEVVLNDGSLGRSIAPAGASKGKREALELRDGTTRFGGLDVMQAVANVNDEIARALIGTPAHDQSALDQRLIALDGNPAQNAARRQRNARRVDGGGARDGRFAGHAALSVLGWARGRR